MVTSTDIASFAYSPLLCSLSGAIFLWLPFKNLLALAMLLPSNNKQMGKAGFKSQ